MTSRDARNDALARSKKRVKTSDFFAVVLEALDSGSRVAFTPRGRSMTPTLRDARDVVYLTRATNPTRYDVVLYRRDSGQYVLHRIVGVASDGTFVLCGDGQTALERGIRREQILAKVAAFKRGALDVDCETSRSFRLYSRFWVASRSLRALFWRFRNLAARIARRCLRRNTKDLSENKI